MAASAGKNISTIVNIDPTLIETGDNIRFGLKRSRLDSLKADILESNGIHTPGEVEPLVPPVNGKTYRLTVGAYRLASAIELNEQEKAGILFPAFVKASGTALDRLKRQLSENIERETMSPLDTAVAIRKLLDEGVSKSDIREIFARPGGKKGTEMVPASNAWLNMTLSFLDLPKPIQEKIHLGLVGVAAAYQLTKVDPDKREDVLKRAEADRLKEQEEEQKVDEKILAGEKKAKDAEDKKAAEEMTLTTTKDQLVDAEATLKAKLAAATEAYSTVKGLSKGTPADVVKAAEEKWQALETDVKGAKKLVEDKKSAVTKLEGKVAGVTKVATSLKERLAKARTAKAGKTGKAGKGATATGPSAKEVQKAAAAEGASQGVVPLDAADMRAAVALMAKSSFRTIKFIGKALVDCFAGGATDREMIDSIAIFVGDRPQPKVKAAK